MNTSTLPSRSKSCARFTVDSKTGLAKWSSRLRGLWCYQRTSLLPDESQRAGQLAINRFHGGCLDTAPFVPRAHRSTQVCYALLFRFHPPQYLSIDTCSRGRGNEKGAAEALASAAITAKPAATGLAFHWTVQHAILGPRRRERAFEGRGARRPRYSRARDLTQETPAQEGPTST